jgi:hypothetical protein
MTGVQDNQSPGQKKARLRGLRGEEIVVVVFGIVVLKITA